RRLVEIPAMEHDAAGAEPGLHLLVADPSGRDDLAGLAVALAARLRARHHAAGAVDGRVQALRRLRALDAREDHRIVAHGTADQPALARESRGSALPDDPQLAAAMALAPGIVVVIVDAVRHRRADDAADALDHPLAAGIGVRAGERHAGEVLPAELA